MKEHAALVIRDKEKILFIRRSEQKKTLPNIWSFPSGTREEGENILQTAIREAEEELGVRVVSEKIFARKDLSEFGVRLHFVLCRILEGDPFIKDPREIGAIDWLSFPEFFEKFSDDEIGHGLIFLRENPELWERI